MYCMGNKLLSLVVRVLSISFCVIFGTDFQQTGEHQTKTAAYLKFLCTYYINPATENKLKTRVKITKQPGDWQETDASINKKQQTRRYSQISVACCPWCVCYFSFYKQQAHYVINTLRSVTFAVNQVLSPNLLFINFICYSS